MNNAKKQDRAMLVLALGKAINWRDWAETQECHECGTSQGCEDEHAIELAEWTEEVSKAEKALITAHGQGFHDSIRRALDQGAVDNEGYWEEDSPHAEQTKKAIAVADWNDGMKPQCGHLAGDPNCDGCY